MASMSQVWMLNVSIVNQLIWIYRLCWFYWFQCFDLVTLRCCSYLAEQQVSKDQFGEMTPQLMTFSHISMINSLYIGSTLFSQTTHANHAKLVTLITVNLTTENAVASLTVESIDRTWYRPAVLTVRTIETTGCICAIHHLDTTIVLIFDVLCHLRHVVFCGECNYSIIAHVEISRKNYDANHRRVSVILHIMLSSWYRMCSICNSCIIHTDCGDSFARW